ncbi:MAG: hypothetical protein ACLQSR_05805 [Limisphaerales bacterium]
MKKAIEPIILLLAAGFLILPGCAKKKFTSWDSYPDPVVTVQMKSFVAEKSAQAEAADKVSGQAMPPELNRFFKDAGNGNWLAVSNDFESLKKHAPQFGFSDKLDERLTGTIWQTTIEVWGALNALANCDQKYSSLYANEIINSIPPGSIYFGGTDPGRFLISGMEKSQVKATPFFLITQNAMANGTYLDYVRSMYGSQLYIPTSEDSEKCFMDYVSDAKERLQKNQLKPGENVQVDPNSGRVAVSGQVAVMSINGLLAKIIFDQNSNQEFYVEQSFPLDWMYPYLEPHGLILKLDRQPLTELPDSIVQQDHDYWSKLIQPMIGDRLNDDTTVQQVADFAKKVFQENDFAGFTGDPKFVQNDYSCRMFSKERSSIADLYVWRMNHAVGSEEKHRMARAAEFAFLQSWALCPYSPDVVYRYANLLLSEKRLSDALLIAETTLEMPELKGQAGDQMRTLITQLQRFKQSPRKQDAQ